MLVAWMSEAGDLAHRITPSHEKSCYFILLFFLGGGLNQKGLGTQAILICGSGDFNKKKKAFRMAIGIQGNLPKST